MFSETPFEDDYALIGKNMIGPFIVLVILFFIMLRTYFYHRHLRNQSLSSSSSNSLTTPTTFTEERLDPSVLKFLPIFTYSSSAVSCTLHDCAICLSEYTDGDECRKLPNCDHVFHSQCIDRWFTSQSSCPLCRALVQPGTVESHIELGSASDSEESGEGSSNFPEPIECPRRPFRVIVELPSEVFQMRFHTQGSEVFRMESHTRE
ncbi:RING-H2 finger protein ATL5-like [Vicia villosa]|uniref:RING-H2 finger protein ATL5-like n=1 Tax=Vicia villosa TaxID=3911 RepID=UPI00273B806E|nr:RING-H2 finger protein ATL5-like [Vicia villosa]